MSASASSTTRCLESRPRGPSIWRARRPRRLARLATTFLRSSSSRCSARVHRQHAHHDGGELRGIDGKRVGWRGDGHEPGAGPERATCREPGGAGALEGARHHDSWPRSIFVSRTSARGIARAKARARWRKSSARSRRARLRECRYRRGPFPQGRGPAEGDDPGFSRKNVTVATPRSRPPSPLPCCRQCRSARRPQRQERPRVDAADQRGGLAFDGRARPAPNSASTTTPAPVEDVGGSALDCPSAALGHSGGIAGSGAQRHPRSRAYAVASSRSRCRRQRSRRRHCCRDRKAR